MILQYIDIFELGKLWLNQNGKENINLKNLNIMMWLNEIYYAFVKFQMKRQENMNNDSYKKARTRIKNLY